MNFDEFFKPAFGKRNDLKSSGRNISFTPSTDLLNRRLGTSPTPRMLNQYEIELLRQSAHEIAAATRKALKNLNNTGTGSKPVRLRNPHRTPRSC